MTKDAALLQILKQDPHINSVRLNTTEGHTTIVVTTTDDSIRGALRLPAELAHLPVVYRVAPRYEIRRAPLGYCRQASANQTCQNEPVKCGCQIQPAEANWVGTAGVAVHWRDPRLGDRWGVLSNWHVMADGLETVGRPIHQPDVTHGAIAALSAWSAVRKGLTHKVDAAIADALIGGFHTIALDLLDFGSHSGEVVNAAPGMAALKVGRTTGMTAGRCTATGVAVRVGYGDFDALFTGQDVYSGDNQDFSAPGDSGSLIIAKACRCPASLLFAGGGGETIGSPIRFVVDALGVDFPVS